MGVLEDMGSTMKTFQRLVVIFAALVACASAFTTPSPMTRTTFKTTSLAMGNNIEQQSTEKVTTNPNAAAVAAFATALAPLAAHAEVDQGVVIGYGAGLVACVVSLAVGFAIGYGTLVKP